MPHSIVKQKIMRTMSITFRRQLQAAMLVAATALQVTRTTARLSQVASPTRESSSLSVVCALLVSVLAMGVILVGGPFARKKFSRQKGRNVFSFVVSWWKRRQQGYIRQDDTQDESVVTEVQYYAPPPPIFHHVEESVEEISVASKTRYYEDTPILPQGDEESFVSDLATYVPPPDLVMPESLAAIDLPRNVAAIPPVTTSRREQWSDNGSFQSSLESMDSLVDSCLDLDDMSQLTVPPIDMNPSAVIGEHISFLQRQTREAEREERAMSRQLKKQASYHAQLGPE